MEGSIADSTTQRIRSSLQRTGHFQGKQPGEGLFEELLKLPAQTIRKDQSLEDPVADQMAPSTEPLQPTRDDAEPSDIEDSREEETQSDESRMDCFLAVCPPPPTPVIAQPEPSAEGEETPAVAPVSLAVQSPIVEVTPEQVVAVNDVQPEPSELSDESDVKSQIVAPEAPVVTTQAERKESQSASVASQVKQPRTARRAEANANDKPEVVAIQPINKEATVQVQGAPDSQRQEKDSAPTLVQTEETQPAQERAEPTEKGEEREKWYESKGENFVQETAARNSSSDANDGRPSSQDSQTSNSVDHSDRSTAATGFDLNGSDQAANANLQLPTDNLDALAAMAAAASAASGIAASGLSGSASSTSGAGSSTASDAITSRAIGASTSGSAISTNGIGNGSPSTGLGSATSVNASRAPGSDAAATDPANSDSDVRQLSQQERVRLVQRVARSFSRLGPDGGQVTLKLHPPQLGVLNVSIRIEGQTMSAKLRTESSAARDVILENLPQLRDRLAEQGIEVEKFQVDVASSGDMATGGQTSGSSGESSSSGRGSDGSTTIDYRRVSRAAAERLRNVNPGFVYSSSTSPSLVDRSLDVHV